jgi:hypothetical protein
MPMMMWADWLGSEAAAPSQLIQVVGETWGRHVNTAAPVPAPGSAQTVHACHNACEGVAGRR